MYRTEILPGIKMEPIEQLLLQPDFDPASLVSTFDFLSAEYRPDALRRFTFANPLAKYTSDLNRHMGAELMGAERAIRNNFRYIILEEYLTFNIEELFFLRRERIDGFHPPELSMEYLKQVYDIVMNPKKLREQTVNDDEFFDQLYDYDWSTLCIEREGATLTRKIREAAFETSTNELLMEGIVLPVGFSQAFMCYEDYRPEKA